MVSVERFRADAENIVSEIERRCNALEENACIIYVNVRNAQRIFRGYVTRKHIDILNASATCIQKNWRAFVGRIIYEELLKERYDELCKSYHRAMAIRIQSHWKGYWVRSRIFSYYKLKNWLEFVSGQNKNLKCSSQKYQKSQNHMELEKREDEAKEWIVYILFKLHHLLRTHQISGIYSLPKTRNLSEIENMLTCLKYKDFMTFYNSYKEDVRQKKVKEMPPYILQCCKYPAHFEREWYEHKLRHKESYTCTRQAPDRYYRFENAQKDGDAPNDSEEIIYNLGTCECSFCRRENGIKC